jgi:hypothetical protein
MGPGRDQPVNKSLQKYLTLDCVMWTAAGSNGSHGQDPPGPAHERNSQKVRRRLNAGHRTRPFIVTNSKPPHSASQLHQQPDRFAFILEA